MNVGKGKRRRIIERLSKGFSGRKRRKFAVSKVKEALRCFKSEDIDIELSLLESHEVIEKPSFRSVRLVREFSLDALTFLQQKCGYDGNEIVALENKIALLSEE